MRQTSKSLGRAEKGRRRDVLLVGIVIELFNGDRLLLRDISGLFVVFVFVLDLGGLDGLESSGIRLHGDGSRDKRAAALHRSMWLVSELETKMRLRDTPRHEQLLFFLILGDVRLVVVDNALTLDASTCGRDMWIGEAAGNQEFNYSRIPAAMKENVLKKFGTIDTLDRRHRNKGELKFGSSGIGPGAEGLFGGEARGAEASR